MCSIIDLCFMCSKGDNKCNIVDNKIITQVKYLMPEITIIKLRIPLRICSICEKNLHLFNTFKKDCVKSSLRLEARINTDVIEKCTTFETNINKIDEVCIKEEVLDESDNPEVEYSIVDEIFIKEDLLQENSYDSEFVDVLQDVMKEESPPQTDTHLQENGCVDIEDKSRFIDNDSDYKPGNSSPDQSVYSSEISDGELNELYDNRKKLKNKKFTINYIDNKSKLRVPNSESCGNKKKFFCTFCEKYVYRFARHIVRVHKNNIEVQNILRFPAKHPERHRLISLLRNKGTFVNNTKRAYNNGELIVSRRPSKNKSRLPRNYSPCPHCYGYFISRNLYRHICPANNILKNYKNIRAQSRSIELEIDLRKMDLHTNVPWLLSEMRDDEIGNVIKNDFLLLRYASHICTVYKKRMHFKHYARQKLRQLARLLIIVKKHNRQIIDMRDLLQPKYIYIIIVGIQKLCEFNAKTGEFQKPTLADHLGLYLKECLNVQYSICLIEQNEEKKKRITDFKELLALEYDASISRAVRKKLEENKCNKSKLLPTTSDIKLFRDQSINDELQTLSRQLALEENTSISTRDTSENLQSSIMENSSREESVTSKIIGPSVSLDEDEMKITRKFTSPKSKLVAEFMLEYTSNG